jgi:hypothetical protein
MHFTLTRHAQAAAYVLSAFMMLLIATVTPANAETAYISQVNTRPGATSTGHNNFQSTPIQTTQYGPGQMSVVPAPGVAAPTRSGNFAQTIQVGNFNSVAQFQSGQNNVSNVGILGGQNNNVGVWQGGRDLSNLNLVNTQGLSIGVIQPAGSAPINMLIARLPNGSLLIKR